MRHQRTGFSRLPNSAAPPLFESALPCVLTHGPSLIPRKNRVHVPTCVRHDTCADEKGMADDGWTDGR